MKLCGKLPYMTNPGKVPYMMNPGKMSDMINPGGIPYMMNSGKIPYMINPRENPLYKTNIERITAGSKSKIIKTNINKYSKRNSKNDTTHSITDNV